MFVECIEQLEESFQIARKASKSKRVIEQYVEGIEYSVECWALQDKIEVLATSKKLRSEPISIRY